MMLYLDKIAYYLPNERVAVSEMQTSTGATTATLRIFESFYGLRKIAVASNLTTRDMVELALDKLQLKPHERCKFDYVVHSHASREVIPFSESIAQWLQEKFQVDHPMAFGTSMLKCVSALGVLGMLSTLMKNSKHGKALLVTGDIAFTPELRLVPRATICGDAATVSVVQSQGERNHLLAVDTRFLPGYSKGIYLDMTQMQEFDQKFIQLMSETILSSIEKAGIQLNQISLILPHNVNYPTWQKIAEALEIDQKLIYGDQISEIGHCFASDGILNLALATEQSLIQKNQYYLMAGCGLGVFFASAVFKH